MAVVARAALVRTTPAPEVVVRIEGPVELTSGTRPGFVWREYIEATVGSGPVLASDVTAINPTNVTRTRTFRAQNAGEISAQKLSQVTSDLGANPAGRALKQAFEALFFLARQSNPTLTLAQFRTAVEGLNNIPDDAFFNWIQTKL